MALVTVNLKQCRGMTLKAYGSKAWIRRFGMSASHQVMPFNCQAGLPETDHPLR